jgi:hypothetical protein
VEQDRKPIRNLAAFSLVLSRENFQKVARMARFFFHITNGSTFKDEEGENWPSLEAARAHAVTLASELWQDGGYGGYAVLRDR